MKCQRDANGGERSVTYASWKVQMVQRSLQD